MIRSNQIINEKFNELIMKYMSQGYVIITSTMHGSTSGAPIRIDLNSGKVFVRIYVKEESAYYVPEVKELRNKYYYDGYTYYVRVGYKVMDDLSFKKYDNTIWNDDLETIEEYKYYTTPWGRHNVGYTDNLDDIRMVCEKRAEREEDNINLYRRDVVKHYDDIVRLRIAFKRVKRESQTKTVHLENIKYLEKLRNGEYKVTYVTNSGKIKTCYIN